MGRRQGLRSRLDAGEESALYPRLEPVPEPAEADDEAEPAETGEEPEEEPEDEDDDAELERDTKTSQAAETRIPSSSTFVRSATGRS